MIKIIPAAMTMSTNNPAAATNNKATLPVPFLVVVGAVVVAVVAEDIEVTVAVVAPAAP